MMALPLSNDINKSHKWFVVGGIVQLLLASSCWPLPGYTENFFLSKIIKLKIILTENNNNNYFIITNEHKISMNFI